MKYLLTILCIWCSVVLLTAQPAPDFTITATDAEVHSLYADYLNQGKTVVLEIMFTTCPPCNTIAPLIEELNQDWGAGNMDVVFLSLSDKSFDDNSDVAAWENLHGLSYHGAGQDGGSLSAVAPYKAGTYGNFLGTPTFVVISPDGTVNFNPRGPSPGSTVDSIDVAIANTGATPPQLPVNIGGLIKNMDDVGIADVSLTLNNNPSNFPNYSTSDGAYQFSNISLGTNVNITPSKTENPRNGLSILDMVLIQRHLLFIDTLPSPYHFFAADVNNSGGLSILDIIFIQRLLLLVDDQFPNNDSWRFIPTDHVFANPLNPLGSNPPNSIPYANVQMDQLEANFIGIKVGDVSGDANPGLVAPSDQGIFTAEPVSLQMKDQYFEKGAVLDIEIPNFPKAELAGFQFSLSLDQEMVEIMEIEKGVGPNLEHLLFDESRKNEGLIRVNWFGNGMEEKGNLLSVKVRTKKAGYISDVIQIIEETNHAPQVYSTGKAKKIQSHSLALQFNTLTSFNERPSISLAVYPNPSEGKFTIISEKEALLQADFQLYDYFGKPLGAINPLQTEKNVSNSTFSIEHLPTGIYFLRITQAKHKPLAIRILKI